MALRLGHIETCAALIKAGIDPFTEDDVGHSNALEMSFFALSQVPDRARSTQEYDALFRSLDSANSELWEFSQPHQIVIEEISVDLGTALTAELTDVNSKDIEGHTPLHWAALRGDSTKMEALLRAGANIEARDHRSCTALHVALLSGDTWCNQLLLMAGSDVHAQDTYNNTAVDLARFAVDRPESLDLLFLAGADLSQPNFRGSTPLRRAAYYNHHRNAAYLLDAGVDIDCKDDRSNTPLLEAVRDSTPDILPLLLSRGAGIHERNNDGHRLLHLAAAESDVTCIRLLQQSRLDGLSTNLEDKNGKPPRDLFAERLVVPDDELAAAVAKFFDDVDARVSSEDEECDELDKEYANAVEYLMTL